MSDKDVPDNSVTVRSSAALVGGGLGVLATLVFGSPELGALIGGASGPAFEKVVALFRRPLQRMSERVNISWTVTCALSGYSSDQLMEQVLQDDRRVNMTTRILRAAAESESEDWVRALGAALAKGLAATDDAEKDKYARVITTLASLDPIDARFLEMMSENSRGWEKRRVGDSNFAVAVEEMPELDAVVDPVFSRLPTRA
jgi:hypothetical protein